jgi:hypothetical protein
MNNEEITCSKGDYVLAAYDRSCYAEKVLGDDVSDQTLHIDLMVESGKVVEKFRIYAALAVIVTIYGEIYYKKYEQG